MSLYHFLSHMHSYKIKPMNTHLAFVFRLFKTLCNNQTFSKRKSHFVPVCCQKINSFQTTSRDIVDDATYVLLQLVLKMLCTSHCISHSHREKKFKIQFKSCVKNTNLFPHTFHSMYTLFYYLFIC